MRDCPTPIMQPQDLIKKAVEDQGDNVVVSWSGGRCSTAVLHMALQIEPEIRVVFCDTGVEFPETYDFIEKVSGLWNLNLRILKPKTTFWKCVEKYGFPMLRGKYFDNSVSKAGRPMCCILLKERPMLDAEITASITGLRACESRMRMFGIAQRGQYYYAKTLKRFQYHPIALWSNEDLSQYTCRHSIPLNEVYAKEHERCGCWCCTAYCGWRESLATSHPRMYRFLMKQKGEPLLWEYLDNEGCQQGAEEPMIMQRGLSK